MELRLSSRGSAISRAARHDRSEGWFLAGSFRRAALDAVRVRE
jgi:hypothetical protein